MTASSGRSAFHLAKELRPWLWLSAATPPLERWPLALSRLATHILARPPSRALRRAVTETWHDLPGGRRMVLWQAAGTTPRQAMLYLHGGGWTFYRPTAYRAFGMELARQSGLAIYDLDYRLAPEHPYPAALEDVEQAWEWLVQRVGGDPSRRLIIGGDSAGGNLATVFCRRLRDRGSELPAGQFLLYPVLSMTPDTPSYERFGEGLLLTKSLMAFFIANYLRGTAGRLSPRDPELSPIFCSNLKGLPKTVLVLAEQDIAVDEGRAYARALEAQGVDVRLDILTDMLHGFPPLSQRGRVLAATTVCATALRTLGSLKTP